MYLFTVKSDRIQFPIVKEHILTNYFEITRKLKYKRNGDFHD